MAKRKKTDAETTGKREPPAPDVTALEAPEADAEALEADGAHRLAGTEAEAEADALDAQEADAEACEIDRELCEALAKRDEYLALAQRVQADFENFRRRNQNVRKEAYDDGTRTFAKSLLPIVDNLERAIGAAKDSPDASLREGVEMVYRQLCETFDKRGIRTIDRKGERFDPNLENAVMQGTPEDGEPGTVCEVLQKGYTMGDMVIRHAMVKVVPE